MALEPIPDPAYCPPIGSYFLSAGKTLVYQCVSAPLCRIYWDKGKPTAWTTESAWYDTGDPQKGWRRNGPNYPSFFVRHVCIDTNPIIMGEQRQITLRHKPIVSNDLAQLITIIKENRQLCLDNPTRPDPIALQQKVIERMTCCT